MSELQNILAEPDDPRSVVEIAMDLLSEHDREAFESALRNSQFPSSQLSVAIRTDGKVRDAGLNVSRDAIYNYRRGRGWI